MDWKLCMFCLYVDKFIDAVCKVSNVNNLLSLIRAHED